MSNGYAIYPECIIVQSLSQARRLAIKASLRQENGFSARVESCDTQKTIAVYRHGCEKE